MFNRTIIALDELGPFPRTSEFADFEPGRPPVKCAKRIQVNAQVVSGAQIAQPLEHGLLRSASRFDRDKHLRRQGPDLPERGILAQTFIQMFDVARGDCFEIRIER